MAAMSLGSPLSGGMVYRGPLFVPGAGAAGSTQTGTAPTAGLGRAAHAALGSCRRRGRLDRAAYVRLVQPA